MLARHLVVNLSNIIKRIVTLNDISDYRIKTLKSNLNRLRFNPEITNKDFTKIQEKKL